MHHNSTSPLTMEDLDVSVIIDDNDDCGPALTMDDLDMIETSLLSDDDTVGPPLTLSDLETTDNCTLECAVCLENINKNKNIAITKCNHTFCFECIGNTMMTVGNNCPLCRAPLLDQHYFENNDENDEDTLLDLDYEDEDEDEDEYEHEDEDEHDDEDDNEENNASDTCVRVGLSLFHKGPITEITDRFLSKGYTPYDMMSILLQQYDKNTQNSKDQILNNIKDSLEQLGTILNEEREIVEMTEQDVAVV